MKKRIKILMIVSIASLLAIGCEKDVSKKNDKPDEANKKAEQVVVSEENDIPYLKTETGEIDYTNIDNSIIDERYEKVNKKDLKYETIKKNNDRSDEEQITKIIVAEPLRDKNYASILQGYTYFSEVNPTRVAYDEAIELVNKVLPDDIVKVKEEEDTDVNKKYIFYSSEKGNFVVGLCYGYEFNENNEEELRKDIIVGIDYLREV
ncbi:hypothetical protein CHL78_010570 [Romboutsia weinsteinii]|uniref:Lipoprotein n=1 Tax=Romboutsia weinsteinii TaxID=2020949 RepID=A0A371J304_9FIRM|nr:hypothetical protein [Romboutsia weinsteinii]RDY27057.1 hypothetical protein CHL78_010570 [Romboutsia weinsteinii]